MAELPTVSVIIPIAPGGECEASLASVRRQDYDQQRIQILVAIGRHRSIQRNAALKKATGDIVWFMDNDVTVEDPGYLRKMVAHYADARTASVGGPSLTPDSDSLFQRTVGQVLGSFFATQSVRARYRSVGRLRPTNERELILCSQTFRRDSIQPDGFDERLHSGNEENELMNRLDRAGRVLLYDPDLVIYRSQRPNLKHFLIQMGKYGKSRMEHFLIRPAAFEALFMVPLAFAVYLVLLPLLALPVVPELLRWVGVAPLVVYATGAVLSALAIALRTRSPLMLFSSLLLLPLVHLGYALGNVYALFHRVVAGERELPPVIVKEMTGTENRASVGTAP